MSSLQTVSHCLITDSYCWISAQCEKSTLVGFVLLNKLYTRQSQRNRESATINNFIVNLCFGPILFVVMIPWFNVYRTSKLNCTYNNSMLRNKLVFFSIGLFSLFQESDFINNGIKNMYFSFLFVNQWSGSRSRYSRIWIQLFYNVSSLHIHLLRI